MARTLLLATLLLCVATWTSFAKKDAIHAQAGDPQLQGSLHRRDLTQISFVPSVFPGSASFSPFVGEPFTPFVNALAPEEEEAIVIFPEEEELPAEATDPDAQCTRCPEDTCAQCECATGRCVLPKGSFGIFGASPVSSATCASCRPRSQCSKHFWFCKRSRRG